MNAPMYDGRKIANLLLSHFRAQDFDLSNLKLNKVLFFVHAHHLVMHSRPVVRNHFEAWEHGPVIRVVYDAFKKFGSAPISSLAEHLNYETGERDVIRSDDVLPDTREFIIRVASHYVQFSASRLREMSHRPGGPWDSIFTSHPDDRGIRDRIPNELIRKCLADELGTTGHVN